jgi:hypothetical protein
MFVFFNDPEGPNLLIVIGTAVILYFLSLAAYLSKYSALKKLLLAILIQIAVVGGLYWFGSTAVAPDYKNIPYAIEGESVKLENGFAETAAAPGSASKVITRYFGNEVRTDLNADGREDIAFILTQDRGGSGTFFYAVGAVATDEGYIGSDGYFLGDRIAPQATSVSQNPVQKNVVVFNYAERKPGEPMTASPSVGKSVYLKLDPVSMRWGIVVPDFEGESR